MCFRRLVEKSSAISAIKVGKGLLYPFQDLLYELLAGGKGLKSCSISPCWDTYGNEVTQGDIAC